MRSGLKGIKKMFLDIVKYMLPTSIKKQLSNFHTLASRYGQFGTIRKWSCINSEGEKIPWYTYPAIEYLNNIDFSQKTVFEYGSGNSSAYWARKAKVVFSVEDNLDWYKKINETLASNQHIVYCDNEGAYLNAINEVSDKIDVFIIDGVFREKCAKVIKNHMTDNSIIILDNSDWYKETSKYLREYLDLIEVDFHGFGPINNYTWTTSIFFSRKVKLVPINNIQPNYSIASIKNGGYENFPA